MMEGYLQKKGEHGPVRLRRWQKRWFVLREGWLSYTKDEKDTKAPTQIPIKDARIWISNESKLSESQRGCVFHVLPSAEQIDKMKKPQAKQGLFSRVMVSDNRTYFLQAKSAEEAKMWVTALQKNARDTEIQEQVDPAEPTEYVMLPFAEVTGDAQKSESLEKEEDTAYHLPERLFDFFIVATPSLQQLKDRFALEPSDIVKANKPQASSTLPVLQEGNIPVPAARPPAMPRRVTSQFVGRMNSQGEIEFQSDGEAEESEETDDAVEEEEKANIEPKHFAGPPDSARRSRMKKRFSRVKSMLSLAEVAQSKDVSDLPTPANESEDIMLELDSWTLEEQLKIQDRYPTRDYNDLALDSAWLSFAFPVPTDLKLHREATPARVHYSVVTSGTKKRTIKLFATFLNFCEPLTLYHGRRKFTRYLPKSMCLISHYPQFDLAKKCIQELFRSSMHQLQTQLQIPTPYFNQALSTFPSEYVPTERLVSHLISEVPLPVPGKTMVSFVLGDAAILSSLSSTFNPLTSTLRLDALFRTLSVSNIIRCIGAILGEGRILLHSSTTSLPCVVVQSLLQLVYPFEWGATFIPLLPQNSLAAVGVLGPFLLGVASEHLPELERELENVLVVDLDQDETAFFESSWDPHSLLPLPAKAMDVLDGELRGIVAKARSFDDCVAFPVGTVGPMHVLSVSRRSDGYGPLSDSGNTTYSKLETEVSLAMLGFFNDFLSGFRRFIFRLKEGPQINATEFIKSRAQGVLDPECMPWLEEFLASTIFSVFLDRDNEYDEEGLSGYKLFHDFIAEVPQSESSKATLVELKRHWAGLSLPVEEIRPPTPTSKEELDRLEECLRQSRLEQEAKLQAAKESARKKFDHKAAIASSALNNARSARAKEELFRQALQSARDKVADFENEVAETELKLSSARSSVEKARTDLEKSEKDKAAANARAAEAEKSMATALNEKEEAAAVAKQALREVDTAEEEAKAATNITEQKASETEQDEDSAKHTEEIVSGELAESAKLAKLASEAAAAATAASAAANQRAIEVANEMADAKLDKVQKEDTFENGVKLLESCEKQVVALESHLVEVQEKLSSSKDTQTLAAAAAESADAHATVTEKDSALALADSKEAEVEFDKFKQNLNDFILSGYGLSENGYLSYFKPTSFFEEAVSRVPSTSVGALRFVAYRKFEKGLENADEEEVLAQMTNLFHAKVPSEKEFKGLLAGAQSNHQTITSLLQSSLRNKNLAQAGGFCLAPCSLVLTGHLFGSILFHLKRQILHIRSKQTEGLDQNEIQAIDLQVKAVHCNANVVYKALEFYHCFELGSLSLTASASTQSMPKLSKAKNFMAVYVQDKHPFCGKDRRTRDFWTSIIIADIGEWQSLPFCKKSEATGHSDLKSYVKFFLSQKIASMKAFYVSASTVEHAIVSVSNHFGLSDEAKTELLQVATSLGVKEGAPNKQFQPLAPGGLEYMGMIQEDGLSSLTLSTEEREGAVALLMGHMTVSVVTNGVRRKKVKFHDAWCILTRFELWWMEKKPKAGSEKAKLVGRVSLSGILPLKKRKKSQGKSSGIVIKPAQQQRLHVELVYSEKETKNKEDFDSKDHAKAVITDWFKWLRICRMMNRSPVEKEIQLESWEKAK